jgi:hypothetical protein
MSGCLNMSQFHFGFYCSLGEDSKLRETVAVRPLQQSAKARRLTKSHWKQANIPYCCLSETSIDRETHEATGYSLFVALTQKANDHSLNIATLRISNKSHDCLGT